jgi:phosphopantothenoylcysteine decarboxylase/phosphopantothenate--cysteine ligase
VTLITGPTHLAAPHGVEVTKVRSAAEMHAAVMDRVAGQDVVIMSAAVADYTPAEPAKGKVKKGDGPMTLTLYRTRDILADVGKLPSRKHGVPVLVGFAAETADVAAYAKAKLQQKGADLIVANDVSRPDAGFDVETNAVTLVSASGAEDLAVQPKAAVASRVLDRVEQLLAKPVKPAKV